MTNTQTIAIPLDGLPAKIHEEHTQAVAYAGQAVEHACRAGEWLIQAKGQLEHGEWQAWLAKNVRFSDRTAQGYMRLAKNLPRIEGGERQRVALLPLREALKYLAGPKVSNSSLAPEAGDAETGDVFLQCCLFGEVVYG